MAHIEIHVNQDDLANPRHLLQLAAALTAMAGDAIPVRVPEARILQGAGLRAPTPIAPDDNPDAGIPAPTEAFRPAGLPTPAAAFGAPPNALAVQDAGSPAISAPPTPSLPPAVPSAPSVEAVPAPAVPGVELDKEGLPWDVRIHASSKEKVADGTWKLKRGVGAQVVWLNQIKAELHRALGNAPAAPAAAIPNPAWPFPTPSPTPLPPAMPAPAASNVGAITLVQLMPRITSAMSSNPPTLTADQTGDICKELSGGQIGNVAMLAVRPDLVPHVWARLDQLGIPQ